MRRLSRVLLCVIVWVGAGGAVGAARAGVLSVAGSDERGWVALEYAGQGVFLFDVPGEGAPGTMVEAALLPRAPEAMGAWGDEVWLVYEPAAATAAAGGRPQADGAKGARSVRRVSAVELARAGAFAYSPPEALPPLPSEGGVVGILPSRGGAVAVLSEPVRLMWLRGGAWVDAAFPAGALPERLLPVPGEESPALIELPEGEGERAALWTASVRGDALEWSRREVAVRGDVVMAWIARRQLYAAYRAGDGEGSGWRVELVRGSVAYPQAEIPGAAAPAALLRAGDRFVRVSAVFSPGLRISARVVSLSGEVLHDGPAVIPGPVSRREVETLLLMLGSLALSVIVFVIRPAGMIDGAVAFPEGYALAESGRRFTAGAIDLALGAAGSGMVFGLPMWRVLDVSAVFVNEAGAWPLVAALGFAAAHSAVMEAAAGRTVGKMLTGCRTISVTGRKPSAAQAAVRNVIKYACPPLALMALLGPPTPGAHSFGTLVVRRVGDSGVGGGGKGRDKADPPGEHGA